MFKHLIALQTIDNQDFINIDCLVLFGMLSQTADLQDFDEKFVWCVWYSPKQTSKRLWLKIRLLGVWRFIVGADGLSNFNATVQWAKAPARVSSCFDNPYLCPHPG